MLFRSHLLVWYRKGDNNMIFYGSNPVVTDLPPGSAKNQFEKIANLIRSKVAPSDDTGVNAKNIAESVKDELKAALAEGHEDLERIKKLIGK